jgi:tRNA pseudouridine32 synthase/23S rRNA pseudouridine746 synthase
MKRIQTKNGVGPSTVVLPSGTWPTILDFLVQKFPDVSRAEWIARMDRGDVLDVQGGAITQTAAYCAQTKVHYYRDILDEPAIPFEANVLYQDDHLIVADKPHFLPVMPAGRYVQETLLVRLKRSTGIEALVPLHRIDRDTAGLVLFAVQPATRARYVGLFKDRTIEKRYEAIARARDDLRWPLLHRSRLEVSDAFMQMQEVDGIPNSETSISMIERRGDLGRYELKPITGRRHQLRAHMAALGMPIINDRLYPALSPHPELSSTQYERPLQLLAKSLAFTDPITHERREFKSTRTLDY